MITKEIKYNLRYDDVRGEYRIKARIVIQAEQESI